MARTLTNPITQPIALQQIITRFVMEVPHKLNDAGPGVVIDRDAITIGYEVVTSDENGERIKSNVQQVPVSDWPAAIKTNLKTVYSGLHTHAESVGLIVGAGTDEPLE